MHLKKVVDFIVYSSWHHFEVICMILYRVFEKKTTKKFDNSQMVKGAMSSS